MIKSSLSHLIVLEMGSLWVLLRYESCKHGALQANISLVFGWKDICTAVQNSVTWQHDYSVMVSIDSQLGSLKLPWRKTSRRGRKMQPFRESVSFGPIMHRKERLSWVKACTPFGSLVVNVTWPAASSYWSYSFLATMDCVPWNRESEWTLPWVAFVTDRRKETMTEQPSASQWGRPCFLLTLKRTHH